MTKLKVTVFYQLEFEYTMPDGLDPDDIEKVKKLIRGKASMLQEDNLGGAIIVYCSDHIYED